MAFVLPAGVKSAATFGGLPGRNPGVVPPNLNGNANVLPPPVAATPPSTTTTATPPSMTTTATPPSMTTPHIAASPDVLPGLSTEQPSAAPGTQNFIGEPPPVPVQGVPSLHGVQGGVIDSIAHALHGHDHEKREHGQHRWDRFFASPRFAELSPDLQTTIQGLQGQQRNPFAALRGLFPNGSNSSPQGG